MKMKLRLIPELQTCREINELIQKKTTFVQIRHNDQYNVVSNSESSFHTTLV